MSLYTPNPKKPFPFSRSKIALFMECPRCLYLELRLGVRRPDGPGFAINAGVDTLLKREFDRYREAGKPHPYMVKHGIKAVPAKHDMLDEWRNTRKGVYFVHLPTNFRVYGAIDDLWLDEQDLLLVTDYKATAKREPVTVLDQPWHEGYKRQLEVYQWLLRQNGESVSDMAYFLYCRGRTEAASFNGRVEFEVTLIPHHGSDGWVEPTLFAARACLDANRLPKAGADCKFCKYRETARKAMSGKFAQT
ncbi:PD-(D/E)XK nuclease family protein [Candidatus Uhrbacteria bacterium]|nr:PD-(D/E)XK nuclease family protein [Candidatus Uhrbacteria bacterium]